MESKNKQALYVFNPWRRYFARMFDIFLYSNLWLIFITLVFKVNINTRSAGLNFIDSIIPILIMVLAEPLLLSKFGTTVGKAIFGLKITTSNGEYFTYHNAITRTLNVVVEGMGYYIPIYSLFKLYKSYTTCDNAEVSKWDLTWEDGINYEIKDIKAYRIFVLIISYILIFAITTLVMLTTILPPNKGEVTIAEFSENYNYYLKNFDIDYGFILDENGKWIEKSFSTNGVNIFGYTELPNFVFKEKDGYINSISFEVSKENEEYIALYGIIDNMIISSLSFSKESFFERLDETESDLIVAGAYEGYDFVNNGIKYHCKTEYSGYIESFGMNVLWADDEAQNQHYKLEFLLEKE